MGLLRFLCHTNNSKGKSTQASQEGQNQHTWGAEGWRLHCTEGRNPRGEPRDSWGFKLKIEVSKKQKERRLIRTCHQSPGSSTGQQPARSQRAGTVPREQQGTGMERWPSMAQRHRARRVSVEGPVWRCGGVSTAQPTTSTTGAGGRRVCTGVCAQLSVSWQCQPAALRQGMGRRTCQPGEVAHVPNINPTKQTQH